MPDTQLKRFHLQAKGLDILLEGYNEPVAILERVLTLTGSNLEAAPNAGPSDKPSKNARVVQDATVSIDSYMSEKKPASARKMLEETAKYISDVLGEETFSKERLLEVATSSKYYRRDWRNQNSVNISRMVDAGFLVHLLDGTFRVGD